MKLKILICYRLQIRSFLKFTLFSVVFFQFGCNGDLVTEELSPRAEGKLEKGSKLYNSFDDLDHYYATLNTVLYKYDKEEVKELFAELPKTLSYYETAYPGVRAYCGHNGWVSKLIKWEDERLYELKNGDNDVHTLADNPALMALTNEYNCVKIGSLYYMFYSSYLTLVFNEYNEEIVKAVYNDLSDGVINKSSDYLIVRESSAGEVRDYDNGTSSAIVDFDFVTKSNDNGIVYENESFVTLTQGRPRWRWTNLSTGKVQYGRTNLSSFGFNDTIRVEVDDNDDPTDGVIEDTVLVPRSCLIIDVKENIVRTSRNQYSFIGGYGPACNSSLCRFSKVEIELYIDGVLVNTYNQAPFSFSAPGASTVEVKVDVEFNPDWYGWFATDNPPFGCTGSGFLPLDCDIRHTPTMFSRPRTINGEQWRVEGQVWVQTSGWGDPTPGEVGARSKTYKWLNGRWRGGHAPDINRLIGSGNYIDNANNCELVFYSGVASGANDTNTQINHDHNGARALDVGSLGTVQGLQVQFVLIFDGQSYPLTFDQGGLSDYLTLEP